MRRSSPDTRVRVLTSRDVSAALNLSNLAGWNQTEADWRLLLQLEPEACLALECGGQVVATATVICYDDQLAWVGMVLTHPEYRRRGFARCLLQRALNIAEARGVRSVKLDATDEGSPLYASLGFRREQEVQRWSYSRQRAASVAPHDNSGSLDFALDRQAFGADRGRLLSLLVNGGEVFAEKGGFLLARSGARASFLGPCVARTPEAARCLVGCCLSTRDSAWFWDLLPSNCEAVRIATDFGFRPQRTLIRMVKGQDARGNESMVYAGGGFEFG